LCDCLASWPPPILVPVSESHIRRHHTPPWPDHDPDCDFFRDHLEQRVIARSFARRDNGRPASLIGRLSETGMETEAVPRVAGRSYGQSRGTLATTLMQLIDAARLNVISMSGGMPSISEQFKAIRLAARGIQIDDQVRLSEYLCTYLPALPELMVKIANTPASRFATTNRPRGVLIMVVADATRGSLRPLRREPLPVRGRIAIFGEREGHSRQTSEERRCRSHYLAACVVAQASAGGPVEVLKAYLHPCASAGYLMPMDSDLERRTLTKLVQLQDWLQVKAKITVSVRKPVFDASPALEAQTAGSKNHPSGPVIPDFILEKDCR
jgi:hypothetical protein